MKIILFLTIYTLVSCSTSKVVESSFENGSIDKIWKTKKLTEGGWEVQKDIVRSGKYAIKFTLKRGMKEDIGGDGKITERIELKERDKYQARLEEDHRYKFSFFIPQDFLKKKVRLVIGQWKQEGDNSPLLAQRYVNGIFYVTISNTKHKKIILKLTREESDNLLGRWIDVEFSTKFSVSDGFVLLKIDKHMAKYRGALAFPNDGENVYFKFGLYRDQTEKPMTIFFDNYQHFY